MKHRRGMSLFSRRAAILLLVSTGALAGRGCVDTHGTDAACCGPQVGGSDLAAIVRRPAPVAPRLTILLPSADRLGREEQAGDRPVAAAWRSNLLETARAVERSNIFAVVKIEDYDTIDRARIDAAELPVLAVHGDDFGLQGGGWYLYLRPGAPGVLVPFDRSIVARAARMNSWLDTLEAAALGRYAARP